MDGGLGWKHFLLDVWGKRRVIISFLMTPLTIKYFESHIFI